MNQGFGSLYVKGKLYITLYANLGYSFCDGGSVNGSWIKSGVTLKCFRLQLNIVCQVCFISRPSEKSQMMTEDLGGYYRVCQKLIHPQGLTIANTGMPNLNDLAGSTFFKYNIGLDSFFNFPIRFLSTNSCSLLILILLKYSGLGAFILCPILPFYKMISKRFLIFNKEKNSTSSYKLLKI